VLDRLDIIAFPALKTYDPPLSVLLGATVTDVTRHGKFLDCISPPSTTTSCTC
jgi:formamidopyrimidine-DNA glycosylase